MSSPELQPSAKIRLSLGLRARLALGFIAGFIAVVTIAVLTVIASDFNADQQHLLQQVNERLAFAKDLDRAVLALQISSSRFIYLGYESERQQASRLFQQWDQRVSDCELQACLNPKRIHAIKKHLKQFYTTFELVAESRRTIADSLKQSFAELIDFTPQTSASDSVAGDELAREALHLNSVSDHISVIEAQLLAYFLSSDSSYIAAAENHLAELRSHLASVTLAKDPGSATGNESEQRGLDIAKLEDTLYANIQRIRSYSYLVNVVMASDAHELVYLADEIAGEVGGEIVLRRQNIEDSRARFYRWLFSVIAAVLVITGPIFLWVLNSVTSPLRSLAAVFRRLADGSEEEINSPRRGRDEIADLYEAAIAFREENIRERQLLNDYRELSQNLELEVAKRTQELRQKNAELDLLASTDKLTSCFNRRSLDQRLTDELGRSQRYGRPLTILLMDIDHFKGVNDEHGHLTGDKVLIALSDCVRTNIRSSDVFGRWGGEEFLVICPETDIDQGQAVAEKVRLSIEQASFPVPGKITISIGVGVCSADDSPKSLVAQADKALYEAKTSGRNRVCISPQALQRLSGELE